MKLEKSKEKKEGFHITITDLTTGETLIDESSEAILGSIVCDDGVHGISYTHCNALKIIKAVTVTEKVVKSTKEKVVKKIPPELISELLFGDNDEDEEEEEDDDE
jgi:hypothetical protein